jgi:hypothetical protein
MDWRQLRDYWHLHDSEGRKGSIPDVRPVALRRTITLMPINEQLRYKAETRTVQDLVNLYENRHLNLKPDFQRNSVWSDRDRADLIDSVLRNYPIPALFLHRREQKGILYYDVIDGKQRLGVCRNEQFLAISTPRSGGRMVS